MIKTKLDFKNAKQNKFELLQLDHMGNCTKTELYGFIKKQENGRAVGTTEGEDKIYVDIKTGLEIKEKDIAYYLCQEDFRCIERVIEKFKNKINWS